MKKNIYFLIILLCSISFIRVLFTLNEENIHISKDIDISAIVTKIKKDKASAFFYGLYYAKIDEERKRKRHKSGIANMMFFS